MPAITAISVAGVVVDGIRLHVHITAQRSAVDHSASQVERNTPQHAHGAHGQ